jgi:hypothetical protein
MAVFIKKSPVTSSNCYKTKETASILIKLGTNVDWTIAFVTKCSVLNFLLPWQRGGHLKIAKNHYFALIFPSKLIFDFFLAMRGTTAPFKPPKPKGAHPPSGNPLIFSFGSGQRRKSGHFFKQHFSNKNKGLNKAFLHHLRQQIWGGALTCVYIR